jgi:hypothetical protein
MRNWGQFNSSDWKGVTAGGGLAQLQPGASSTQMPMAGSKVRAFTVNLLVTEFSPASETGATNQLAGSIGKAGGMI